LTSWDPGHQQCHWRPPKGAVFAIVDVFFGFEADFSQKNMGGDAGGWKNWKKSTAGSYQGYGGSGGWFS